MAACTDIYLGEHTRKAGISTSVIHGCNNMKIKGSTITNGVICELNGICESHGDCAKLLLTLVNETSWSKVNVETLRSKITRRVKMWKKLKKNKEQEKMKTFEHEVFQPPMADILKDENIDPVLQERIKNLKTKTVDMVKSYRATKRAFEDVTETNEILEIQLHTLERKQSIYEGLLETIEQKYSTLVKEGYKNR